MINYQYDYCGQKLEKIIELLDELKENIDSYGGFQTETLTEEFQDNIEQAVVSIEECIENLDADEAVLNLKR